MENPRSEEEKIIKDIRNLFKLKKGVKGIKESRLSFKKNFLIHLNINIKIIYN